MALVPSVVPATTKLNTLITDPPLATDAKNELTAVALAKKLPTEIPQTTPLALANGSPDI